MKNDEWLTPPYILKPLGKFDLDPCAPRVRPWSTAKKHYHKFDDGLNFKWTGRVWLNPPFGREVDKWIRRMKAHNNGIALVAARTETKWFFDSIWHGATAICFLEGRPHFHFIDGTRAPFNSGAPICLVAYGKHNAVILRQSGLGYTVTL